MWRRLAWLVLAGALGTLARYWMAGAVQRLTESSFPWGTLAVNALACFLFGMIWSLAGERFIISGETRLILLTGFVGTFSTFSTYMFEAGQMMRDAEWLVVAADLVAQNLIGLSLLFAGMALGRLF